MDQWSLASAVGPYPIFIRVHSTRLSLTLSSIPIEKRYTTTNNDGTYYQSRSDPAVSKSTPFVTSHHHYRILISVASPWIPSITSTKQQTSSDPPPLKAPSSLSSQNTILLIGCRKIPLSLVFVTSGRRISGSIRNWRKSVGFALSLARLWRGIEERRKKRIGC